jgi:hypothetical protein
LEILAGSVMMALEKLCERVVKVRQHGLTGIQQQKMDSPLVEDW